MSQVTLNKIEQSITHLTELFITSRDTLEISINDLAISTQNHFMEIDKRFDLIDERFIHMENRLSSVETKIDKIDTRLVLMEGVRYNTHEVRIENLEDSMRTVKTELKIK